MSTTLSTLPSELRSHASQVRESDGESAFKDLATCADVDAAVIMHDSSASCVTSSPSFTGPWSVFCHLNPTRTPRDRPASRKYARASACSGRLGTGADSHRKVPDLASVICQGSKAHKGEYRSGELFNTSMAACLAALWSQGRSSIREGKVRPPSTRSSPENLMRQTIHRAREESRAVAILG